MLRVPGTPGSRFSIRADRTPWFERGLRMITTERPGYGASTRLEGRGFVEHSDDMAAILDTLGIDALPVYGGSGASPHILDFAARHPERVSAATILVGAAPLEPDEAEAMIDLNALEYRLFHEGRFDELWQLTVDTRDQILADPLAGFRAAMESSTPADLAIIDDPSWQRGFVASIVEALREGPGGWYDEGLALEGIGASRSSRSRRTSPGGTAMATATRPCRPRGASWRLYRTRRSGSGPTPAT